MLTWRRKSTTVFPWTQVLFHIPSPVGERKSEAATAGLLVFFFPVYDLPFVGNNIGLSSGNTLQLLRWEQHTSLDWSSVASCTTPWALCQETVPIQLCVTAHLETPPGHDGRGHKDKEGDEWSNSRQNPLSWVPHQTPTYRHPSPSGDVCQPLHQISVSMSLFQHYCFFCTPAVLIFFLLPHEKTFAFLLLFLSSCYGQIDNTVVTAPHWILGSVLCRLLCSRIWDWKQQDPLQANFSDDAKSGTVYLHIFPWHLYMHVGSLCSARD